MDELARLKHEYVEGLGAKAEALALAFEEWTIATDDDAMGAIRRIAHKLKGSGGVFGYMEISDAAEIVLDCQIADLQVNLEKLLGVIAQVRGTVEPELARILVVDDDETIRKLIETLLKEPGREILTASSGAEATKILDTINIHLMILDLKLPDMDGRDVLAHIRADQRTISVPVLVMTGQRGSSHRAECFAYGADMFFEKPFPNRALTTAVSARLAMSSHLTRSLATDPFTGLPSRASFTAALEKALHRAERMHRPVGVALLSVDGLEQIEAADGTIRRDEALLHAVEVIKATMRNGDYIAPWGGHEFAVFFQGENASGGVLGLRRAEKILRETPFEVDGMKYILRFSAGMVLPSRVIPIDEIISGADAALFSARKQGPGSIVSPDAQAEEERPLRALFADDDEELAMMVVHRLAASNIDVDHAIDGDKAVEMLSPDYDVILLDIDMPGKDGFEVLKESRARLEIRATPVIMVTASGDKKNVDRAFTLGADDYIVKPISVTELAARIHRHVDIHR